jgi:DNA (cytosine-5)-methyltransferase 1
MEQVPLFFRSDELIVDNFAGGGGASTGIEAAFGRHVDIALNHDMEAVLMHAKNHPYTHHYCEDVYKIDPVLVTQGKPVGLAWFSPDCKHFSKAKGGKPVSKKIRGLAWIVIKWAAKVKPRVIMLENVEEFQDWGPLLPNNMPCPARRGRTFQMWKRQLEHLGYAVEVRQLRACDYGAPTIRKRLFVIARRDGQPIVWPAPTHGDPKSAAVQEGRLLPWRTAAECINWSLPCPSIFARARPLAEATMRRIARGIQRYVIEAANPFIVPLTHTGTDRVEPIDEPLRTTTCAHRGERAVVAPTLIPRYGEREGQSPRAQSVEKPIATIVPTANGAQLVEAFLAQHNKERVGVKAGRPVDAPISTITASGGQQQLVTAHVTKFRTGSVGSGADEPLHTVTAGGDCKRPAGAAHAMGVVSAQLVGVGGRAGQSRPRDVDEPAATLTAKADTAVVASTMLKMRNNQFGQDMMEAFPTLTAGGGHVGDVRAFLMKYYGEGGQWADPRDPMHTVPTKHRMGLVTVAGEEYVIADIGMRMLSPRELYRAQGFPDSYIIDVTAHGKTLSKSAQVRMCGNSVCPPVAEALVRANFADEIAAMQPKRRRRAA